MTAHVTAAPVTAVRRRPRSARVRAARRIDRRPRLAPRRAVCHCVLQDGALRRASPQSRRAECVTHIYFWSPTCQQNVVSSSLRYNGASHRPLITHPHSLQTLLALV